MLEWIEEEAYRVHIRGEPRWKQVYSKKEVEKAIQEYKEEGYSEEAIYVERLDTNTKLTEFS